MPRPAPHILTETVRTTAQASRLIRSDGGQGHVHVATVIRWILDGIQVGDKRVYLEAVRVGSRWLTSEEALKRFSDQLTAGRTRSADTRAVEVQVLHHRHEGATMTTLTIGARTFSLPLANALPSLAADERAALEADIKASGVLVPVVITDENEVLDGHHRLPIAAALGLTDVPVEVVPGAVGRGQAAAGERRETRHLQRPVPGGGNPDDDRRALGDQGERPATADGEAPAITTRRAAPERTGGRRDRCLNVRHDP